MSELLLLGCIAALGGAVGIAAVLLADRVEDFFSFYRRQFSRNAEIEMADMFIFANGRQLFILNLMLLVMVPLLLHVLFKILVVTLAGAGLALFVPRRRMWVKATPSHGASTLEYAGLARGEDPALAAAVDDLVRGHERLLGVEPRTPVEEN